MTAVVIGSNWIYGPKRIYLFNIFAITEIFWTDKSYIRTYNLKAL